jgi:hypothetical protein
MNQLTETDFVELIGNNLGTMAINRLKNSNFQYDIMASDTKERIIIDTLEKIESCFWHTVGDKQKWESGWDENYQSYKETNDREQLQPKYMMKDSLRRYKGEYIQPVSKTFESDFSSVILYSIFEEYLANSRCIFDFGCGTGANLVKMADVFPKLQLHGLDWAQPTVDTINLIRERTNLNITGHLFNMYEPDYDLDMPDGSIVFTCGALEQIGSNFHRFLDFVMYKKPAMVIHVEPIIEFYDRTKIMDYVAHKFHKYRGYLDGYYTQLVKLQNENKINILKNHRGHLGGLYHDSYSIVIWQSA